MNTKGFKAFVGGLVFESGLNAVLFRSAAVVIAFHRVSDLAGPDDGLTVGVSAFERYCQFVKRHFDVVALSTLVNHLERGQSLRRQLAITFDDGYRDNFESAAPILADLSLPATFFVVSDFIGSAVVPWWDRERHVQYPWMTWDQVRQLRSMGFEIGGHTRTHVDLGTTPSRVAVEEISGARTILEDRLGARVDSFAYPYGGRRHMSEMNRAIVKAAGFRCCCSSFGGINPTGTDPYHLQRVPISPFYATPHQFAFDVSFGRSVLAAA